jgi:hypothetical protein
MARHIKPGADEPFSKWKMPMKKTRDRMVMASMTGRSA